MTTTTILVAAAQTKRHAKQHDDDQIDSFFLTNDLFLNNTRTIVMRVNKTLCVSLSLSVSVCARAWITYLSLKPVQKSTYLPVPVL
jgi:hypothetical protein